MNENHHIDKLFIDAYKETEKQEIKGDWLKVKNELVRKKLISKPNNRKPLFYLIILLLISSTGIALFYYYPSIIVPFKNSSENKIVSEKVASKNISNEMETSTTERFAPLIEPSTAYKNSLNAKKKDSLPNIKNNKAYRVQVGAYYQPANENYYMSLENIYKTECEDGFTRYFSGEFSDKEEAVHEMNKIRSKGFDAFVVETATNTVIKDAEYSAKSKNAFTDYPGRQKKTQKSPSILTSSLPAVNTEEKEQEKQNAPAQLTKNNMTKNNLAVTDTNRTEMKKDSVIPAPKQTAASEPEKKNNLPRDAWRIGPYFSVDRNEYSIDYNSAASLAAENGQPGIFSGNNNFMYNIGFITSYNSRYNIILESGLLFSQRKKISLSDNLIDTNLIVSYDIQARYLELPIHLKGYIQVGKSRLYLGAGLRLNANFPGSESTYKEKQNKTTYIVKLEPTSIGGAYIIFIGSELYIREKLRFYIQPEYMISFSPLVRHESYSMQVTHFLRSISLGFGLHYDISSQK